jgi:hypothetical protein
MSKGDVQMKRATLVLAVLVLMLGGVGQSWADFIYDATGTFSNPLDSSVTYTLSGMVTFNNTGGLVSANLLVKTSDGKTTYVDTAAGNPTVSLSTITDVNGTVYDNLSGNALFTSFDVLFLPSGIGGSSPIDIVPLISLSSTSGQLTAFSTIDPSTLSLVSGQLVSGQLTPQGVPEPSTLTLLGLGSLGLLGYGWRRRRQSP